MTKAKQKLTSNGFDVFEYFKTDKTLEAEGVWVKYDHGIRFLIASTETKEYQKAYADAQKRLKTDDLDDDNTIYAKVFAKHLLLDWSGIAIKGEIYPYSFQNAVKLLVDVRQIALFVLNTAADFQTFKAQEENEEEKN